LESEYLQYGFATEDKNNWVCEPCYDALRDTLEFAPEVT
jgi:hypothetical protein